MLAVVLGSGSNALLLVTAAVLAAGSIARRRAARRYAAAGRTVHHAAADVPFTMVPNVRLELLDDHVLWTPLPFGLFEVPEGQRRIRYADVRSLRTRGGAILLEGASLRGRPETVLRCVRYAEGRRLLADLAARVPSAVDPALLASIAARAPHAAPAGAHAVLPATAPRDPSAPPSSAGDAAAALAGLDVRMKDLGPSLAPPRK